MTDPRDVVESIPIPEHGERPFRRIYIAGPLWPWDAACPRAARERNIAQAVEAFFALSRKGWNCYCPHFSAIYGHEIEWWSQYEVVLPRDFDWLSVCDALLLLPGWESSRGTRKEWLVAQHWDLTVYYSVEEVPDLTVNE